MFNIINLPMYGMTSNMNNKMSNNHLQYSENGHQQSTDSNQSTKLTFVDRLRDNVFIWDSLKLTSSHNTTESNSVFYTNSVDTQETESMVRIFILSLLIFRLRSLVLSNKLHIGGARKF